MFEKARLKLTGWYLLIIMVISASFSIVIYRIVSQEIDRFASAQRLRIERRMVFFLNRSGAVLVDEDLVGEIKRRLLFELFAANSLVFILSGWLSFLLSEKAMTPIKEMVEEQNRFISDASHELKTPLTSLKTSMEVGLRDKKMTLTEAKILIGENIEEVDKLQSLSEGLLELSHFEHQREIDRNEYVDLKKSLEEVLKTVQPLAKKKGVVVESLIDVPAITKGSRAELNKLWTIFLENAIKYTSHPGRVRVSLGEEKRCWVVKVADEGVGIPKNELSHIFDRFYRADTARTKTGSDGYGLGLAIAKKIIEAHGAKVEVKSEVNIGTTFKLAFRKQN